MFARTTPISPSRLAERSLVLPNQTNSDIYNTVILVLAREAAKRDQLRHRHRLGKFLLRYGKRPVDAGKAWTRKYLNWIRIHVHFEQPAAEPASAPAAWATRNVPIWPIQRSCRRSNSRLAPGHSGLVTLSAPALRDLERRRHFAAAVTRRCSSSTKFTR